MRIHNLGLDVKGAVAFLKRLVAMHEPSCGNPNLEFRLDVDEFIRSEYTGIGFNYHDSHDQRFVASFYHYGSLDLFAGDTALEAMNKLIDGVLTYYQSAEYKDLVTKQPGKGHGFCHHGDDKKLIDFAISFSGLNEGDQAALRAEFV